MMLVMAVRDAKAEAFMQPFFAPTHGVAERSFVEALKSPETPMGKYPEDFALWCLGKFDEVSGVLVPEAQPVMMVTGSQFMGALKMVKES